MLAHVLQGDEGLEQMGRSSEVARGAKASQRWASEVMERQLHVAVSHWGAPVAVVNNNNHFCL
jgi:hypothetical protein